MEFTSLISVIQKEKTRLRNYSLRGRSIRKLCQIWNTYLVIFFFFSLPFYGQPIANYVSNGGFEDCGNCQNPIPFLQATYWTSIDSLTAKFYGEMLSELPPSNKVPTNSYTYQWPVSGTNYFISEIYFKPNTPSTIRGYPKNRLKRNLQAGTTYCVKFYCNITNNSTYGVNGIGAYFGDASIDTITQFNKPISYLLPQVQYPNIVTDTLNWVAVSGTFSAVGTEKYLLLGNFKSDAATNSVLINPTYLPLIGTDVLYDDVSCIPIDLPAYAGIDKSIKLGDSAFIGRQPDVGIDEACIWYKLPGSTPIATIAGLYVKPVVTSTYVVKQQIWCGSVKYDTVVVYMNLAGVNELSGLSNHLKIYPVPASDKFILSCGREDLIKEFTRLTILNSIGQIIREEEIEFKNRQVTIDTSNLPEGVYTINLSNYQNEKVIKKLLISK